VTDTFCNRCGNRNPEGSNFCSTCGAVLIDATTGVALGPVEASGEAVDEDVVVEVEDVPSGTGLLVVKRGPNAGSRFLLSQEVTSVGRGLESDIFLDDITVSRRHAEIRATDEGFVVKDVGSLNGTYLNRERIEEAKIGNGDELQVGKFRLVFLVEAHGG
jgi:pSer/pThr/pTyr-binding forkhead associated (FHA) protein